MNGNIRFKINRHVALVVMVLDDFTDKPLTGSQVQAALVNDNAKPICRKDGFFVFTDCTNEVLEVCVQARNYTTENITVNLSWLNPLNPVLKIRLKPNRYYIMPKDATVISGKAEAGAVINIIRTSEGDSLKLLYDFNNKDEVNIIDIYNPSNLDLEGKSLALCEKGSENFEIISIAEKLHGETERYKLNELPKKRYKKVSTIIYQVSSTKADEKGDYFIPVGWRNLVNSSVTIEAVGNTTIRRIVEIKHGKENVADLL